MTDVIKHLNQEMNSDDPAAYRLPENRALGAQYFLLYEMSLPFGLDTTDRVDLPKSATRLTVTVDNLSSREILELDRRAQAWLAENAAPALAASGTGPTIMFADIGQRNASSLVQGNLAAVLLISTIFVAALRSVKLGLLSLVPNMLPALLAFGIWGLIDGEIGLAVSIVTIMTFGIVVDDTIHFMTGYCAERRARNASPEEAITRILTRAGKAIFGTSLILVAGFLVLALSAFRLNASMGLLTALVMLFALLADLLLMPALLMVFDREPKAKPQPVAETI
jgi:predicted RND superfamily exporter protein